MKKIMILVLALLVVLTGCAGNSTKDDDENSDKTLETGALLHTVEEGKFIVGFDQDFPPMGFIGEDGEFTGFDIELAKATAEKLGYELVLQPIAWDAKDMELESGNIDCIWNGFTITGREEGYEWTKAYMANQQVFVVKADSGIKTKADLAGKVVAVQTDSAAQSAIHADKELLDTFAELVTVADYNTGFLDLMQGATDALAMDEIVARYQIANRADADFIVLDEALSSEEYGVGFKKGNTGLRDQVQTALEELAASGKIAEISVKWFGKDITTIK